LDQAKKLKIGYKLEKDVDMGPLIRKEQKERVIKYIENDISEGAKMLIDGRTYKNEKYPDGFFLGPTIFHSEDSNMIITKEEIFGPVASIITAENFDQAIELINRSLYKNASSIYTNSDYYTREYVYKIWQEI
jgi:malonate-semialdehyde dehydrogenase (acetylating)/methylmalonate-semialdehyde dehydrogenase